jgi:hypothetical protein
LKRASTKDTPRRPTVVPLVCRIQVAPPPSVVRRIVPESLTAVSVRIQDGNSTDVVALRHRVLPEPPALGEGCARWNYSRADQRGAKRHTELHPTGFHLTSPREHGNASPTWGGRHREDLSSLERRLVPELRTRVDELCDISGPRGTQMSHTSP